MHFLGVFMPPKTSPLLQKSTSALHKRIFSDILFTGRRSAHRAAKACMSVCLSHSVILPKRARYRIMMSNTAAYQVSLKLHSSVVITLFLIINSYSFSTKKCHKMRHFDKNIQNFLRRGHLESTKIRHFNPKILKNFLRRGNPPQTPSTFPFHMVRLHHGNAPRKHRREVLGGNLRGKFNIIIVLYF